MIMTRHILKAQKKALNFLIFRDTKDFSGLLRFIQGLNLYATLDLRPGNISPQDDILKQIKKIFQICKKVLIFISN